MERQTHFVKSYNNIIIFVEFIQAQVLYQLYLMKAFYLNILFGLQIMKLIILHLVEIGEFGNIFLKVVLAVFLEKFLWIMHK